MTRIARSFRQSGVIWLCCCLAANWPTSGSAQLQSSATEPSAVFLQLDTESDGRLTETELLALPGKWTPAELRQRLRVFDFDQNGTLSADEFHRLPGVVPRESRGPLADPLEVLVRAEIDNALSELIIPVAAADLSQLWQGRLPSSVPLDATSWDADADGQVDREETLLGLEIAWGLRRFDGQMARAASGWMFNGSYFGYLDRDGDHRTSREELLTRHFLDRQESLTLFAATNRNSDEFLDLSELADAELILTDVPKWFLRWDHNADGEISREELQQGELWQRNLARHMLPAFDGNGDDSLNIQEYMQSPLGHPLVNWTSTRTDHNSDGHLDLEEFFPPRDLCGSGLAALFFRRLDLNRDQTLDLTEMTFTLDLGALPLGERFARLDRNHDGQLTRAEALTLPGQPLNSIPRESAIPQQQADFQAADFNHDGLLSLTEFSHAWGMHRAAEVEFHVRTSVTPQFADQDRDHNGSISLSEWIAPTASDLPRKQQFLMADGDENGELTIAEFASLSAIGPLPLRPAVTDPLAESLRAAAVQLQQRWPQGTSGLGASRAAALVRPNSPQFSEADLAGGDLDRNGTWDLTEVIFALEQRWGVRWRSGEWLRRPNGQVFNLRTFVAVDVNHDWKLHEDEFYSTYWKQGQEARNDFGRHDRNHDRHLQLSELLQGTLYWIDTQQEFLRYDADTDGRLSANELQRGAASHEKQTATRFLTACDENHDGVLSFREFRFSPLANPLLDFEARRWDADYDGSISAEEFHRQPLDTRWGEELSAIYFRRLDTNRDGRLTYEEFPFAADLKREPAAVVFQILDTNANGALQLDELLARERPRHHSSWAQRRAEQRAMEVEEAFLATDLNQDRQLTLNEFTAADAPIRDAVLGNNPHRNAASSAASPSSVTGWRTLALISANLLLFGGLGWWHWQRQSG